VITIQELKDFAETTNLKTLAGKLKPIHWNYAEAIIAGMREDTEGEMNRSWSRLPKASKPSSDDKLARVIPELISRYLSSRRNSK